jgi:hypothetical protein
MGDFFEMMAFISYSDIMNYKFVIRASNSPDKKEDFNSFIVGYNSLFELVKVCWRLD